MKFARVTVFGAITALTLLSGCATDPDSRLPPQQAQAQLRQICPRENLTAPQGYWSNRAIEEEWDAHMRVSMAAQSACEKAHPGLVAQAAKIHIPESGVMESMDEMYGRWDDWAVHDIISSAAMHTRW